MNNIFVLGMGPGSADYVLPITHRLIAQSSVLFGAKRHLEPYLQSSAEAPSPSKICYPISGDLNALAQKIKAEREQRQVAVLLSGDPGFYGMLDFLRTHFADADLQVVPGISAFQYLMSKISAPWHSSALASLHGRSTDFLALVERHVYTVLLTDAQQCPHFIAQTLVDAAMPDIEMVVGADLSYATERIFRATPAQILQQPPFTLATVVLINRACGVE